MEFEMPNHEDDSEVVEMTGVDTTKTSRRSATHPPSLVKNEKPPEPIVVETVSSEEDHPPKNNSDHDFTHQPIELSSQSTIRWSMTLLGSCLALAACLTLGSSFRAHHKTGFLFLLVVWIVLAALFVGLIRLLQALERDQHVFHPYIHAVADRIAQEYQDFREDWMYEYQWLMIENGEAGVDQEDATQDYQAMDDQQTRVRKPKSTIFRNIVKPLMRPIFARRRKRKLRKQQEAENYVPPQKVSKGELV